jgi:hypothetical protein
LFKILGLPNLKAPATLSSPAVCPDQGQNAKYSFRAHIACFAAGSGLKSDLAGGPFGAKPRHVGSKIVTKKKSRPKAAFKLFLMIVD